MANFPINIIIVDDHQLVLDGLSALLKGHSDIKVAFTTTRPDLVTKMLVHHDVQLMITDIMMPGYDGIALAKAVREKYPHIQILALSMNCDWHITLINDSDIAGYALKNIDKEELETAILKIASGNVYFSPEVLEMMQQGVARNAKKEALQLTSREIEIIRLIEQEKNNKQIAAELFISERTVETHRKNIFRKTKTNTVLGLVKFAYEHNIITPNVLR